jgi:8-oxo-dGTP pyrophosphatase MutT (NUDIX family)
MREVQEEIGCSSEVGQFLGCVEHRWDDNGHEHYEINHVYRLTVTGLEPGRNPASQEAHLELFWSPIEELAKHNLMPGPLIELIARNQQSWPAAWWATTLG